MLNILGIPVRVDNCYRWRLFYPFQALEAAGLAKTYVVPPDEQAALHEMGFFNQFDVVVFERQLRDVTYFMNRAQGVGVAVVYDIDDDLLKLRPTNLSSYLLMGQDRDRVRKLWETIARGPEETAGLLAPFRKMPFERVWALNRECQLGFRANLKAADLVTVPSLPLAKRYSKLTNEVTVLPNLVDETTWKNFQPEREEKERIHLTWAGGDSHIEDLAMIQRPLREVLAKYPQVELHLVGFPAAAELLFAGLERLIVDSWGEYEAYQARLSQADVGLAPSLECLFNQGKSAIRVYELLLATHGAAAIVASETTYGPTVRDLGCGLVVGGRGEKLERDWVKALGRLIEDPVLRQEMGRRGYKKLLADGSYTFQGQVHLWMNAFEKAALKAKERWQTQSRRPS